MFYMPTIPDYVEDETRLVFNLMYEVRRSCLRAAKHWTDNILKPWEEAGENEYMIGYARGSASAYQGLADQFCNEIRYMAAYNGRARLLGRPTR